MAEYPKIIAKNIAAIVTLTASRAAVAGYEVAKMVDNYHHTSYKANAAGNTTITANPTSTAQVVDCVVIEPMFTDAAGYYIVSRNGSSILNTNGSISIASGVQLLQFASGAITTELTVQLVTAAGVVQVRHFWMGQAKTIPHPLSPFDPEKEFQPTYEFDNENGVTTKRQIRFTKRLLSMTINRAQGSDYTNLQYLHDEAFKKGLPFYYFFKPETQARMGHLYEFNMSNWDFPYNEGIIRELTIEAQADYTPDRTTATDF